MGLADKKFGVLLLNMGGPGGLDEVEDYIFNLLADPCMVRMPLGFLFQKPFARMVARKRAPRVKERYKLIGCKSPIEEATRQQAKLLQAELGLPVYFAMRYTNPRVGDVAARISADEVEKLAVIPLYPQYSTVSTVSSLTDLASFRGQLPEYRVVDRHFSSQGYIAAMRELLEASLHGIDLQLETKILFVAHSIPEAYITAGDPYAEEVEQTAAAIHKGMVAAPDYYLAYQSRVGPVKWRGPALEEILPELVKEGVDQLVVQPLSFVSENLETLYDLDIVFRQMCDEAKVKNYIRVPALGNSPGYINALAGLAKEVIGSWGNADA